MAKSSKKHNFIEGEFKLPELEEKVLKFWSERDIFEKSLERNKSKSGKGKGKNFVFYEGPPYANGKPALHHVLARVVKDVMLRYKTMQGYSVPRRAGWDTHGLPVEMAAEKALGFKTKKDIEAFGVERFNEEAKKQVWIHKDEWERLTRRIGYWVDLKNAYVTYAPEYIESIWWSLAQIAKRDLLYKGHKVVPWCTRCGTSLSSHELAQGYKEVFDRSVYIKFKLKPGQYILSWTTTPWTLPGNVALAVGEKISYAEVRIRGEKETYILAKDLVKTVFKTEEIEVVRTLKGKELVGLSYEPLFEVAPLKSEKSYKIYSADFVTTTDGTGVVHTAVMYGEDDYELGKQIGLPQHHTVDEEGKFTKDVAEVQGQYVKSKETEDRIFEYLKERGTLLRTEEYKHEYPFCWRCGTPILYYTRTSWFIGMSTLRKQLLAENKKIHWMPEHIRDGRFGEWLREAKDWNLSRERYWGAPLPIWECKKCNHREVVGSLDELDKLGGGSRNSYIAVRHGESENVAFDVIDSGNQKFHLTSRGRRQIEAVAKKLSRKNIDLIFASDLVRTRESAEIIEKVLGKKVVFDKRLREIDLASLSGRRGEEYTDRVPNVEDRFSKQAVPGAETMRDVRARAWDFLQDVEKKYSGKNILIVSHEDTIWMLCESALGWSEKMAAKLKEDKGGNFLEPAGVVEFGVKKIPRDKQGGVDLHRPFVDDVVLPCSAGNSSKKKCDGEMKRVREVADVWFDSGAMPYAQAHYPFAFARGEKLDFPADYIAEGMDQLRGWFYTLIAIATALGFEAPYRNVITFGLMNDKFGNKMSKSKGNVIEPFEIIDKYGVDAVRWYFFSGTPFGEPKNFDEQEVGKVLRKVHLIVYNSFVFWKTYAKSNVALPADASKITSTNVLDQWILAKLNDVTASVTAKLEAYQVREASLEIESFVDDLSRWYIRRSRKRLQRPESATDYTSASVTLGFALRQLVTLMAPFTPFFSEALYSAIGGRSESVHLEDWPTAKMKPSPKEQRLIEEMRLVREMAAAGLAKRAELKIKVRQPLASMSLPGGAKSPAALLKNSKKVLEILADEVNVKKIAFDLKLKEGVELDAAITPALREEGLLREVARMVQELRQKANLEPKDIVVLMIDAPEEVRGAVQKYEKNIKSDVGAKLVEYKRSEKFDVEVEGDVNGHHVWIGIWRL